VVGETYHAFVFLVILLATLRCNINLLQKIQQEVNQGDQANERKLTRWLNTLADLTPDIFRFTTDALLFKAPSLPQHIHQIVALTKQKHNS
jgi:hypothetical protein